MRMLRLLPALRALSALALFAACAVLPPLHEWRVGKAEAQFHAKVWEPGSPTVLPERSGHQHHNDRTCALCPLLARPGAAAPGDALSAATAGPGALLASFASSSLSRAASLLPPSRAPPIA